MTAAITDQLIRVISARDMHRKERVIINKRLKTAPKFASEAAERAFWEKNDSTGYLDWKKAQLTLLPNLKPSTQTISLRLPQHLFDLIKTAANARDVPYQSLIKVWLQEKVQGS
jgi:predicted DNA binding CopG/RHH family protein